MDDLSKSRLVQSYVADINNALLDSSEEDILTLFKDLYNKEQLFAKKLRSSREGKNVYMQFIQKISETKGRIKIASKYFRAREESYLSTINIAIREVKPKMLYDVHVNHKFCQFALETLIDKPQNLIDLFNSIKMLREEIITKHLYLSIHKAKVFKKNSYGSPTPFDDLIQIANEGLIIAVDKYVMVDDDASSFHNVAIGRMMAALIESGNDNAAVLIGGHAGKKLYRIRKFLQKYPNATTDEIVAKLKIEREEVVALIGAVTYQSLDDYAFGEDDDTRVVDRFSQAEHEETHNQYEKVEKYHLHVALHNSFDVLSIMEQKVLRLKGVKINENNK